MYKFRLHENPDYGWQPRLSSRDFFSVLSNLTAIKIRGTYSDRGKIRNKYLKSESFLIYKIHIQNIEHFLIRCWIFGRFLPSNGSTRCTRITGQLGRDVYMSRRIYWTVLRILCTWFPPRTYQRWSFLAVRSL